MKHLSSVFRAISLFSFVAAGCAAHSQVFTATLNGLNESPVNTSPGTGTARVTLNSLANTMRVQASFSGLTGTTSASHIHAATTLPGVGTAGVATTTPTFALFPLGVTSGTYDNLLDMTLPSSYNPAYVTANGGTPASAEAALFAAIISGKTYFNIHTTTFGGGEIRGFLVAAVPEPGSVALLIGMGLAAGSVLRRRRK